MFTLDIPFSSNGFTPVMGIFIVISLVSLMLGRRTVQKFITTLISYMINTVLCLLNPIEDVGHTEALPTIPYVFPNGQGNVEKFLNGRVNSAKWAAKYGGLYRLWSGTKGEVVLTTHTQVELVFRDSHTHTKAHANNSGFLMDRLLGSCLGLISGTPWTAVKSAVETPFLHRSSTTYVKAVQDFTRQYMRSLSKESPSFSMNGNLHPVNDLKLFPFLFVARVVYGPLDPVLERELKELIPPREKLFRSVIGGGLSSFSIAEYLPLPEVRALRDFKRRWAQWNDRAHDAALKANSAQVAPIVGMYQSVQKGSITREQLLQTLDEILFANIDVTMGGLSWTLVFLATHSATQEALRAEIKANSSSAEARDAYLLSSFTSTPTLLGACILESSRLRPLAAFSVPQASPTPRILDGFQIPAGTDFIIDSYALNIRDPFWGEDREKFRPRRWLERAKGGRDLRYRYWRFGFGPRTCLGKYVAELILRSMVVELVGNWDISMEGAGEGKGTDAAEQDGDVEDGDEEMNWPWDDEMWIHHPDLMLKCRKL